MTEESSGYSCDECGAAVKKIDKFCPNCGIEFEEDKPLSQDKVNKEKELRTIIDEAEPTYYSDSNGVRITSTRLIVPGKTKEQGSSIYAMAILLQLKLICINPIGGGA
jgi:uncharacterized membrane protein YvbJ